MINTRLANLLIDTADCLADCKSDESTWTAVTAIASRIGANAVNAAGFLRGTRVPVWARFSMDQAWLSEYSDGGFHEVDQILAGIRTGKLPAVLRAKDSQPGAAPGSKGAMLRDGLERYRYRYLCCHCWNEGAQGKAILFSTQDDPEDLFGPGTDRALRSVSALLAAHLKAPGAVDQVDILGAQYKEFSVLERDVLSLLANGNTNEEIGQRLSIADDMVQRHLSSAQAKMGAETPEQALALALARRALSI